MTVATGPAARLSDVALSGPALPARSGTAKQLVVFLHGYGADGNDLIEIGREWSRHLPDAAFASPHAPERCSMAPTGRQWFGLTFRDPHERWRGVNAAGPVLDAWLTAELARRGLDDSRLALVGFSQGTMMALHVGLRRARPAAAIVGYSGALVLAQDAAPETLKGQIVSRPPLLLVHGDADEVIPVDALFGSAEMLAAADVPVQWHLTPGLGHGIDPEGLRQGLLLIMKGFGVKPGPELAPPRWR